MRQTDIWLFRIGSGVVTFLAVIFGAKVVGKQLHERYAYEKAHRTRSEAEEREDALELAHGYNDTQGYKDMMNVLTPHEMNTSFAKPHEIEEKSREIGAVAAVLMALLGGESARLWARKREAQRRLSSRR